MCSWSLDLRHWDINFHPIPMPRIPTRDMQISALKSGSGKTGALTHDDNPELYFKVVGLNEQTNSWIGLSLQKVTDLFGMSSIIPVSGSSLSGIITFVDSFVRNVSAAQDGVLSIGKAVVCIAKDTGFSITASLLGTIIGQYAHHFLNAKSVSLGITSEISWIIPIITIILTVLSSSMIQKSLHNIFFIESSKE